MEQAENTTATLPMGTQVLLPIGWTLHDWMLIFTMLEGAHPSPTGGFELGILTLGPGRLKSGVGDGPDPGVLCETAAACVQDRLSSAPYDWEVIPTHRGDYTYYMVRNGYLTEWYFDYDGHVYQWTYPSTEGGDPDKVFVLESADLTASIGTPVFLPTGLCLGLPMPEDWIIRCSVFFLPPGGEPDDVVGISMSADPSIKDCMNNHESEGEEVETSLGTRVVNGITYHGMAYTPAVGYEYQNWFFELDGRIFFLAGAAHSQLAIMESISWRRRNLWTNKSNEIILGKPVPGRSVATPDPPPWEPTDPEGSGLHGSESLDPEDVVASSFAYVAARLTSIGLPEASDYLEHYLQDTGEDIEVDVDKLLDDLSDLNEEYEERQRSIGEYAVEQAVARERLATATRGQGSEPVDTTEPITFPVTTTWLSFYITKQMSTNWNLAIGGMQYSVVGQVTVCQVPAPPLPTNPDLSPTGPPSAELWYWSYDVKTSMILRKQYDWDPHDTFNVLGIPVPAELVGRLHRAGIAQDFLLRGESSTTTVSGFSSKFPGSSSERV